MPIHRDPHHRRRLVRRVICVRGDMHFRLECEPRFDYARATHETQMSEHGAVFQSADLSLMLAVEGAADAHRARRRAPPSRSRAGDSCTFSLERCDRRHGAGPDRRGGGRRGIQRAPFATGAAGSAKSRYRGRWREMVHRSALTLKLLTYAPPARSWRRPPPACPRASAASATGTTATPGSATRAFSLYALLRLGFTEEAEAFMAWLTDRFRESAGGGDGPLQIMYGIDGRADLPRTELAHLEGYRGSRPVRVGNGAADPAAARHLRRADRLRLPLQQVRRSRSPTTTGRRCRGSSTGSATTGTGPTRASGRRAAAARTSPTRG